MALLGSASVNEPGAVLEALDTSVAEYGGVDENSKPLTARTVAASRLDRSRQYAGVDHYRIVH